MKLKELFDKIRQIESKTWTTAKTWEKIYALKEKYALKNSPFKIHDIIEGSMNHRICITKIGFYESEQGLPLCVYEGVRLTQRNTIYKNHENTSIRQNDGIILIKEKINHDF